MPLNLASVLYNNTKGGVQLMAVNTLGVLYIVDNDGSIQSLEDLKGRTVYATGKGATPEQAKAIQDGVAVIAVLQKPAAD